MKKARVAFRSLRHALLSPVYGAYQHQLSKSVKRGPIPVHLGFILDGNRRYANALGFEKDKGHTLGADKLEEIIDWGYDMGIEVMSIYAFSTENFNRPEEEVTHIMELAKQRFERITNVKSIHENKVRVKAIGDLSKLPDAVLEAIRKAEDATAKYDKHRLNICIAYGSLNEIVYAIRDIANDVESGKISPKTISMDTLKSHLYTKDVPDLDLIIRTGGESRLSNFLLLQSAYAELFFTDIYLPEFRKIDLLRILRDYQKRERRYGK